MLAYIIPLDSGGQPSHPIVLPPEGAPPGYWGGIAPPIATHPIAPGGPPPSIWPSPGHPAHPIAPGGPPLGFWGGVAQPGVEHPIYIPITPPAGSGLEPTHPIYIPVYPSHPIANVPTWEEVKGFIFGNLPPAPAAPAPVKK